MTKFLNVRCRRTLAVSAAFLIVIGTISITITLGTPVMAPQEKEAPTDDSGNLRTPDSRAEIKTAQQIKLAALEPPLTKDAELHRTKSLLAQAHEITGEETAKGSPPDRPPALGQFAGPGQGGGPRSGAGRGAPGSGSGAFGNGRGNNGGGPGGGSLSGSNGQGGSGGVSIDPKVRLRADLTGRLDQRRSAATEQWPSLGRFSSN